MTFLCLDYLLLLSLGLKFVSERLTCKFKKAGELHVGIFSNQ